ncbi:Cas10/Cmr2 second palm domain-containing protein [Moraxella atlantae]|uniref:CRISPR-associated protein Cas10/Cmr2, subtype III-B n=1 Tax=Faucicola atlantae TaxID=34059 RepID=A0A1B8QD07_9GAMM|nr:hypothetical protein [Moraxella atlantae]OBX79169.1 hypothetical protein A9306_09210 [Moraxella atlantae]OPH33543.1 hypothetical protein B5J92_09695 [Moraxella atlantae]STY95110.1 CRISPR-associated protein Cas10/Cmr2, subtype III-B [Moraxella atlantae]
MKYAYLFEARGIQRFLFATGKLKDMIAGSELIDYICSEKGYVNQVLEALHLKDTVKTPRIAGGVFYLIFDNKEDALRFQSVWRVASAQWLPGLERVDAMSEADSIKDAVSKGIKKLAEERNKVQIELPNASPITERSPRTGLAAVEHSNREASGRESLDLSTSILRNFKRKDGESLTQRFVDDNEIHFPNNFEKDAKDDKRFPLGRRQLVGLIHADGNGLGEILRLLNDACKEANDTTYETLYKTFSQGITTATIEATKVATKSQLVEYRNENNVIPARPLVLGGDDLSVIVRADLAIDFTNAFLKAFKESSKTQMAILKKAFEENNLSENAKKLPNYLTACAGIVFMKASQPFYRAYGLAEDLCKQAKNYSRSHKKSDDSTDKVEIIPSSIAFYKVNDSILEDAKTMYAQTQIADHGEQTYDLTLPAYLVDEHHEQLANIEDLLRLQQHLSKSSLNDTTLRELATLIHADIAQAKQVYRRWRNLAEKNEVNLSKQETKERKDFIQFENDLTKLIGGLQKDLPVSLVNGQKYHTVLGDLLSLITVSKEAGKSNKNSEVA